MPTTKNSLTAKKFIEKLKAHQSEKELEKIQRYFKTGKGEYGEGDKFIGIKMGQLFKIAKEFMGMSIAELEKLLESPIHEARAGALSIMGQRAKSKKIPPKELEQMAKLYLRRHDRINNWDLVDLAAYHVLGRYLENKPRKILYKLAKSPNMWERRTAIVSTAHFIRQGDTEDAFKIAGLLLKDKEDLVHKATGWMLRFAGSKNRQQLLLFLDKYASTMPRTMLRYAIEHFDKKQRESYLKRKTSA